MLHEANDEMAKRDRAQAKLEQQLQEANSKASDLMRTGARRLLQIATLERELDAERTKGKRMLDELVKQTKMMDLVINFRDQECARDVNELTHDNLELSGARAPAQGPGRTGCLAAHIHRRKCRTVSRRSC